MAYQLYTKSGHNMFEMLSLLQKAIRRGDYEKAGYAAEECFDRYHKILWKRIITVSAEDCFGVVTKEIIALKYLDDLTGGTDRQFVSKAVELLCRCKKSRDACYYACNFIMGTITKPTAEVSQEFVNKCVEDVKKIPYDIFDIKNIGNKNTSFNQFNGEDEQALPMTIPYLNLSKEYLGALFRKSVRTLDVENAGYALNVLRQIDYNEVWAQLVLLAKYEAQENLLREIVALKIADDYVNTGKNWDKRDDIYISKSTMLLFYYFSGRYDSVLGCEDLSYVEPVDWSTVDVKSIEDCKLENGIVPEYVFDVHTIAGKRAGHTDWEMNLVEFAGLKPLQEGFFDNGDWSLRYEYKWAHQQCTEKEYKDMLEYKKGRSPHNIQVIPDRFEE